MILYQILSQKNDEMVTVSWARQKMKAIELCKKAFRDINDPDVVSTVTLFNTVEGISNKELIVRVLNGADWFSDSKVIFTRTVEGSKDDEAIANDKLPTTEVVADDSDDQNVETAVPYAVP